MQLPDSYNETPKRKGIKKSDISEFGLIFHKSLNGLPTEFPEHMGKGGMAIYNMLHAPLDKSGDYLYGKTAEDKKLVEENKGIERETMGNKVAKQGEKFHTGEYEPKLTEPPNENYEYGNNAEVVVKPESEVEEAEYRYDRKSLSKRLNKMLQKHKR